MKNYRNKNIVKSLCNKVEDQDMELIVSNCSVKKDIKDIFIILFTFLKKGGNAILKYRYPVGCDNMNFLFLCYKHFKKISFYKPVYSNNTEFFVICEKIQTINKNYFRQFEER